jgi:hypothetical protein
MFTNEVIKQLEYYVYRLIDPRNGETFYVGKGKGNRVFEHAAGEIENNTDELSDKLKKIREIKLSGFEVQHVIHRHGMDAITAFEVEAALIEAYPSVTNIAGGHGNNDRGVAHSEQIIERYTAKDAELLDEIIEITVNRSAAENSIYDATRYAWRVSATRAKKAKFAIAVINGLIVEVFKIKKWLEANSVNFPEFEHVPTDSGRFAFIGEVADDSVRNRYIRRKVPKREKGAANPIRYHNI